MTIEEIHEYYQKSFDRKGGSRYFSIADKILRKLNITQDTYVLDYGCGTGILSHYLYEKYSCNIDAVDLSKKEVQNAESAWENDKVNWLATEDFDFPLEKYDIIISSQVIEHVHNVGNYLCRINSMLKPDGMLIIGLPNNLNFRFLYTQWRFSNKLGVGVSKDKLEHYDKGMDHINAWDSVHFVTLLASCGFEMIDYVPMEGVAIPIFQFLNRKIGYLDKKNKGIFKNLRYTMYYTFKKVKFVKINNFD